MRVIASIILCILSLGPTVAQDNRAVERVLSNVLTDYIQPRYADLSINSGALQSATRQLCDMPSAENLDYAQSSFLSFTKSWARIEWFRVGPIMSKNRIERILFYPDRKSTGLKQIQRALAKQDQTVTSIDSIVKKSVAVQGLAALEFILFGSGYEQLQNRNGSFRCMYGNTITQNLANISRALSDQWADGSIAVEFWLKPNDENPLFRDKNEALNILIGTMVHGLEALRDVRIGAFLKAESKFDRPKSALMWRSESTASMIENGLFGLRELFNLSRIETLLPDENRNLGDAVRFEFNQAINTARSINKPVFDILATDVDRQKVAYLKLGIAFVISRIDNDFSQQLGLSAGFSFGDGD